MQRLKSRFDFDVQTNLVHEFGKLFLDIIVTYVREPALGQWGAWAIAKFSKQGDDFGNVLFLTIVKLWAFLLTLKPCSVNHSTLSQFDDRCSVANIMICSSSSDEFPIVLCFDFLSLSFPMLDF